MALKLLPIPFPIFVPPPNPNPFHHRPHTEVRLARWSNTISDKFIEHHRAQRGIKDDISSSDAAPNETFESRETASIPSPPPIPGKPTDSHPAFRWVSKVKKSTTSAFTEKAVSRKANVTVSEDGVSYVIDGAPFEFKYSYTETPKLKPLKLREPPFTPFGPATMERPWTGRAPLPPSKKKVKEFDSFRLPPPGKKGVKPVQSPGPFLAGSGPKYVTSRDEILGEPLTDEEIKELIEGCKKSKRQLNMGRDGLIHNMLDNIHAHWKRRRVCKIKCKGVCTVDMDNVCQQLEEKTGGKIIYRKGGVLYLFRGRNYNHKTRPRFPLMLWKPVTPVYPKLIERAPEGLTLEEAAEMRKKGRQLIPICKLAKNGVYCDLVKNVREAFEACELVRINCQGLNGSDYKKIGAKLKDLVPCVLVSFEQEHILMWRGKNWKSSFPNQENVLEEARKSDIDGATSLALPLAGQEKAESCIQMPMVENANLDAPNISTSLIGFEDQGEYLSTVEIEKPYAVTDAISTVKEASGTIADDAGSSNELEVVGNTNRATGVLDDTECDYNGSKVMSNIYGSRKNLDDAGHAGEKPTTAVLGAEAIAESVGSTGLQMEESFTLSSAKHGNLQNSSEPARLILSYAEGVLQLRKQAVESGSAAVLDDTGLDADTVYQRAVAFARSAPPGPVFRHQPSPRNRKVAVQQSKKQESGDLEEEEVSVVSKDDEIKVKGPKIQRMEGSKSSKGSKIERMKGFDEQYSSAVPQGSLRVDELAKLLA